MCIDGGWEPATVLGRASIPASVRVEIVTEEWNYLLNPLHADFGKIRLSTPTLFSFDRRVARARKTDRHIVLGRARGLDP